MCIKRVAPMTSIVRIAFVLLIAGCSRQRAQESGVSTPEEQLVAKAAPAAPVPPPVEPLLTLEAALDLELQPVAAGQRMSPYSYPESYNPRRYGPTPPPTPIPVLPIRKPARILGDRRFYDARSVRGGVALSPDGKRLALGTSIFDANTGELDAAYNANGNSVHKLAFSPDGTRLYCSEGPISNVPTHGNRLVVRDVPGKQQLLTIGAYDWALSGDGRLLATLESVSYDPHEGNPEDRNLLAHFYPAVRIYDTQTWEGVAGYRVRGAHPTAVALSPDGGRIVLGCDDGAVRVWDRATGTEVATYRELCHAPLPMRRPVVHQFAFSPDGRALAAANARPHDDKTPRQVAWWQWPAGILVHQKSTVPNYYYDPTDLRFSPDGRFLFVGRGGASVWDAVSGELRTKLLYDRDKQAVPFLSFISNDRVFSLDRGRPTMLSFPSLDPVPWPERPFEPRPPAPDFETVQPMPPKQAQDNHHPGYPLPDGGRVRVLRAHYEREAGFEHTDAAGKRVRHFEAGRTGGYAVSPDGKLLVTSASSIEYAANTYAKTENPVRFWELATGREIGVIRVYPTVRPPAGFGFSADGQRLAMCHSDGLIRVWDVATREPILAFDPDGYWLDQFSFSTDGRWLVGSGRELAILAVWDTTPSKE